VICDLCPRHCRREREETTGQGVCRSPLAPVVARAALHRWEEPVISGTKGAGTVFFSGCNLHCVYCQNYGISTLDQGTRLTVDDLRRCYRELTGLGAHNIDLVTPTHYAEAILESLTPQPPIPVVYNSNGYDAVETLRRFEGKIQIYLPDLKYADPALAARYSNAPDYFEVASAAIDEMFRQTGPFRIDENGIMQSGVIVRHLLLPGCRENTFKVIDYIASHFHKGDILFSLMRQYLPCGRVQKGEFPELNRGVTDEEYDLVCQALYSSGIEDGFLQESGSEDPDFIPDFSSFSFPGESGQRA